MSKKSIIGYSDKPCDKDSLGMDRKYEGGVRFICTCNTPMTISLNGDWGAGKTSAMNIIKQKLINNYGAGINSQIIEFNTWEFSVLGESENLLINLLIIINERPIELEEQYGGSEKDELKLNKMRLCSLQLLKKLGEGVLSAGYNVINEATYHIPEGFNKVFESNKKYEDTNESILENTNKIKSLRKIREQIKKSIGSIVDTIEKEKGENPKPPRLFIFIDDLDRLDPSVALELIEGMQNYVFCEHCVFILAVDQKVIERGLQNKYGKDFDKEMSDHFFDKVIQLPFKLPINTYDITKYVKELMELNNTDNGDNTANDNDIAEKFAELIKIYGIKNPRTIKRSFNLLRMYQCIDLADGSNNTVKFENKDLKQYAVCLLLMDKNTEEIHSMFSQVIDSSIDYENNDAALHKAEDDFRTLTKKYSEQTKDSTEQNEHAGSIIKEILKIFYGDNYYNDRETYHENETNELISILTLTKPQDINYGNKPYVRIICDIISFVKSLNCPKFITDGSDMSLNDITVSALSDRNSKGVLRFADFEPKGSLICREIRLTWDPTVEDDNMFKLFISIWSPQINKDDPFYGNTEIADAFCEKDDGDAPENSNKYPYYTSDGSKWIYTSDCNRITICIRKKGDLKKLLSFMADKVRDPGAVI